MPTLDFKNDRETYRKVVAKLLRMGCTVEAREESSLVVTPRQEQVLIDAGLITQSPRANGSPSRVQTQKKA